MLHNDVSNKNPAVPPESVPPESVTFVAYLPRDTIKRSTHRGSRDHAVLLMAKTIIKGKEGQALFMIFKHQEDFSLSMKIKAPFTVIGFSDLCKLMEIAEEKISMLLHRLRTSSLNYVKAKRPSPLSPVFAGKDGFLTETELKDIDKQDEKIKKALKEQLVKKLAERFPREINVLNSTYFRAASEVIPVAMLNQICFFSESKKESVPSYTVLNNQNTALKKPNKRKSSHPTQAVMPDPTSIGTSLASSHFFNKKVKTQTAIEPLHVQLNGKEITLAQNR
ncbi:MAG: hypothetical protein ACD_60C00005G0006 [uncultured bacterium]|nr:MAG: hypothetical protein ACD_60C00005G0006 [uncultured bacterium]